MTGPVIGIDPGTLSTGICLMSGAGEVIKIWSIKVSGNLLYRMALIHGRLRRIFDAIEQKYGDSVEVVIEEGLFGGRKKPKRTETAAGEEFHDFGARVSGMAGEVRGLVMAETWRHGWRIRKVYAVSWKAQFSKAEREMFKGAKAKGRAYVDYWNEKLTLTCSTADEIDSVMIARYGVSGKVPA